MHSGVNFSRGTCNGLRQILASCMLATSLSSCYRGHSLFENQLQIVLGVWGTCCLDLTERWDKMFKKSSTATAVAKSLYDVADPLELRVIKAHRNNMPFGPSLVGAIPHEVFLTLRAQHWSCPTTRGCLLGSAILATL